MIQLPGQPPSLPVYRKYIEWAHFFFLWKFYCGDREYLCAPTWIRVSLGQRIKFSSHPSNLIIDGKTQLHSIVVCLASTRWRRRPGTILIMDMKSLLLSAHDTHTYTTHNTHARTPPQSVLALRFHIGVSLLIMTEYHSHIRHRVRKKKTFRWLDYVVVVT